jgi:tRNA pseudouridine55 synthase
VRAFLLDCGFSMDGILLIDKPRGPSSFDVVRKVRKQCNTKKVGHAGTLDPLASGLMVVCLGRYTKFAGVLTEESKVYDAKIMLGIKTSTDDDEGEVKEIQTCDHIEKEDVIKALASFHGKIAQIPPVFSAIKVGGERAYQRARAKQSVKLDPRWVEIFSISLLKCELPEVTIRAHVSKGTYIRSLARDLGEILGVGAYAKEIRRLKAGAFDIRDAIALENLASEDLPLKTGRHALLGLEVADISEEDRNNARLGRRLLQTYAITNNVAIAFFADEPIAILRKNLTSIEIARVI